MYNVIMVSYGVLFHCTDKKWEIHRLTNIKINISNIYQNLRKVGCNQLFNYLEEDHTNLCRQCVIINIINYHM